MREEFQRRRGMFVAGLNRIKGFSCRMPKGAFYVFPNITATGWKSKALADALLEEAGVACLSGTSFGEFGEGYLRFSIANSMENLSKALERVERWVSRDLIAKSVDDLVLRRSKAFNRRERREHQRDRRERRKLILLLADKNDGDSQ